MAVIIVAILSADDTCRKIASCQRLDCPNDIVQYLMTSCQIRSHCINCWLSECSKWRVIPRELKSRNIRGWRLNITSCEFLASIVGMDINCMSPWQSSRLHRGLQIILHLLTSQCRAVIMVLKMYGYYFKHYLFKVFTYV